MMTKINYQPWLQAVLTIAKHYRIEPSEERIRLQLDWNQNQNLDNVLQLMTRQVGLNLRKAPFSLDLLKRCKVLKTLSSYVLNHVSKTNGTI
ncbi:ABC-type bacteriocin/lantibiotic exporter [Acinetobacter baumannii]|nr:ABC-type bacteriocin/lantibiotic exporter [Acinetobacter baumannii]